MEAISLLQHQARAAHDWLEETLGDVTSEQVHWAPEGGPPLGAHYAHLITAEDFIINVLAKAGAPMLATSWEGKTGLSELPPGPTGWGAWGRSVRVDLPALRAYGRAVYANTENYIASLTSDDLDRQLDLTDLGIGKIPLGFFISGTMLANTNWHCGEISCIKGLQGLKGYPE